MGYRVKGTLKLPDGSPASNAEIEFISRKNYSPLVQELKSNILCGPDGAYDVTLEYGEYAVLVYPGGTYPAALGTIILATDAAVGQDLPTLLQQAGWQPATPEYIQQITAWLAEANASATSSAASASAAKVSETNAKSSDSAALSSKNSAASSASTATTKAAEAASSASAALASKNAAATSEANALASKNSAATSATTASAGASTATTKASEASASATAAKVSQDAARVSETNAAASASTVAGAVTTHEGKAGAHPISGVTGLQAALDGKYSPANKPTAADVGAATNTRHYGGDLNNLTLSGFYSLQDGVLNAPSSRSGLGDQLTHHHWDNNAANQTYLAHNTKQMWFRCKAGGNWSSWTEVYHEANVVGSGGIIERGSNANGEYVKFADGTIIMWGIKSTAFAINTATGSMFRSGAIAYDFPTNLLTTSSATVKTNCAGVRVEISTATHHFNSTSQAVAYFLAPTSLTETTYPISFFVTGRWK